ncbi:hypothetical protein BH09PSE2_BH09PSE2_15080 [soil metagenome]
MSAASKLFQRTADLVIVVMLAGLPLGAVAFISRGF